MASTEVVDLTPPRSRVTCCAPRMVERCILHRQLSGTRPPGTCNENSRRRQLREFHSTPTRAKTNRGASPSAIAMRPHVSESPTSQAESDASPSDAPKGSPDSHLESARHRHRHRPGREGAAGCSIAGNRRSGRRRCRLAGLALLCSDEPGRAPWFARNSGNDDDPPSSGALGPSEFRRRRGCCVPSSAWLLPPVASRQRFGSARRVLGEDHDSGLPRAGRIEFAR